MKNIVTYEPWKSLERMHDELNRLMGGVGLGWDERDDASRIATSRWAPAVDIKEEPSRFVLTADIPGVEPKDVEITMENGVLTVKGERKLESDEEREGFRRVERAYGSFYRRFSLPDTADAEGIQATGKNGVVEITIPKKEAVQPKRIEVAA